MIGTSTAVPAAVGGIAAKYTKSPRRSLMSGTIDLLGQDEDRGVRRASGGSDLARRARKGSVGAAVEAAVVEDRAPVDVPDLPGHLVGVEHGADRVVRLREQLRLLSALVEADLDGRAHVRVGDQIPVVGVGVV